MLLTVAQGKHISALRNFRNRFVSVLPEFCDRDPQRGGLCKGLDRGDVFFVGKRC